jgi:inosine-uridine nucleoside N-ribohydrolase
MSLDVARATPACPWIRVLAPLALCAGLLACPVWGQAATPGPVGAEEPTLIYMDNDFLGPGESDIQSVIPLLHLHNARLIGLGVVSGDAWMAEETQHLLRFMEIAGRPDVPVLRGAVMPLLRTQAEMAAWETRYGRLAWKGAWNAPEPGASYHPDDPDLVPPMPEGAPKLRASDEDAAHFLIRMVHEHPGQVTVISAGPLTNIALAVRLSPDLPSLARELVFEGGYLDVNTAQVLDGADYATDFNFLFDPEAAHIVLTAPWKRMTSVGHVAAPNIMVTQDVVDRIGAAGTPVARYFKQYAKTGEPYWDEVAISLALDRSLVTKEFTARMDVDIAPGPDYGRARVWSDEWAPKGLQPVHVVVTVDKARFIEGFVQAATQP